MLDSLAKMKNNTVLKIWYIQFKIELKASAIHQHEMISIRVRNKDMIRGRQMRAT